MSGATDAFDPRTHHVVPPRAFTDFQIGEVFSLPSRTVTDANFAAFQVVSGDNHPIHYDVEYCRRQGHPGLLAHGLQILCFSAAGAGLLPHVMGEALIGFIEQSSKFLKPVYAGDTLYPRLTIAALDSAAEHGGAHRGVDHPQPAWRMRHDRRAEIPSPARTRHRKRGRALR